MGKKVASDLKKQIKNLLVTIGNAENELLAMQEFVRCLGVTKKSNESNTNINKDVKTGVDSIIQDIIKTYNTCIKTYKISIDYKRRYLVSILSENIDKLDLNVNSKPINNSKEIKRLENENAILKSKLETYENTLGLVIL